MVEPKKLVVNTNEDEVEKKYRFGRTLGQGTFATVKLAACLADGSKWAVKIIKRSALTSEDEQSLRTEIQILQLTNHPNIVSVREVFYCRNYVYLVMELMTGGELFDRIVTKDHYSEQEAKQALAQIVTAIKYCHDANIVHRDLKPENILYQGPEDTSPLKLADFGLAALLRPNQLMTVACGTPGYVAPEILRGVAYGKEVDIWSIGVILYILLCGFPPFYDDNNKKLFAQIVSANYSFPDPYWTNISTSAKNLVTQLLVINPKDRLTAQQILEHPWMAEDGSALSLDHLKPNLKSYNARRRFRSAIRAVQITQLLRNLTKQHSSVNSPIDAMGSSESSSSDKPNNGSENSVLAEASGEESDVEGDSAAKRPTAGEVHTAAVENIPKLEKIPEGAEQAVATPRPPDPLHATVSAPLAPVTPQVNISVPRSATPSAARSITSPPRTRPTSTNSSTRRNSHQPTPTPQNTPQPASTHQTTGTHHQTKAHHHKSPVSNRRMSK